jgi:hypothetical protein
MEIIRQLLWLWLLGAASGIGYIIWALKLRDQSHGSASPSPANRPPQQITTKRTPQAPPIARPASASPTPVAPPSSTAPQRTSTAGGSPEYQRRGAAPTQKLPSSEASTAPARQPTPSIATPSADDEAAADLFGGLAAARAKADATPTPLPVPPPAPKDPPKNLVDQAGRIEEYGFHVGTKASEAAKPGESSKPAAPAAAASAEAPAAPKTQTQELDDILKRIDAVLSETDAPAADATMMTQQGGNGGQATLPVPTAPPTEKLERKATDPNQQKLF